MAKQPNAYKKFVATAATATLVASAVAPVASAAPVDSFKDVSKDYKEAVNYLLEKGITKGTSETTFGTTNNIKRGDAAVMIARALNLDTENAKDAGYKDVNSNVKGAVNAIVAEGIASGFTTTEFAPDKNITRQEMAKMLAKAYKLTATEKAGFKDVNANFIEYVSALKEAGITLGKSETVFAPTESLTRGEFALFMYRAEAPGAEVVVEKVEVTDPTTTLVTVKTANKNLTAADFKLLVNGEAVTPTKVVSDEKGEVYTIGHADLTGSKGTVSVNGIQTSFNYEVAAVAVESVKAMTEAGVTTVTADVLNAEEGATAKVEVFANGDTEAAAAATNADVKIVDGKISTTFEGLPAGTHVVRVTVGEVAADAEFTVEAVSVESVSAINTTGVTVKFPALKEALTDVTVEVKDADGKTVEVTPIKVLDVGETTATFMFKNAMTTEPTGTWTVNGVAFDANAQVAVQAVKDAKNQVELLKALQSPYFTGVNADLIAQYKAKDYTNAVVVADVQKLINEVNAENITAEAVKAVREAKNQVELLKALQDGGFSAVNPDLIAEYAKDDAYKAADTAVAVQALVNAANKKAAEDAVTEAADTAATALKADSLTKAQKLVNALPTETDAEKTAKKGLQDRLDMAMAVAKVKDATTQASLLAALKSPVLELKNIDDSLAKFYKEAQKVAVATITNVTDADLQATIVDKGNKEAIKSVVTKIDEIKVDTSTADVKTLLTELKRLDTTFDSVINDALLEEYRADLIEKGTIANTGDIKTVIDTANKPDAALEVITTDADLDNEDKFLAALKAKTLNLKVTDANKAVYFAEKETIKTAATNVAAVQKVIDTIDSRLALNAATTAAQAQTALTKFAITTGKTEYINLSSLAKMEVANLVLNSQDADFETATEVSDAITAQNLIRTNLLGAVNDANDIVSTNSALEEIKYDAFTKNLSASQKVAVAEAFLANFPTNKDGVKVAYTTLTNIKADIDKAITAVAE